MNRPRFSLGIGTAVAAASALSALIFAPSAHAQYTIFTNLASFQAAVNTANEQVETFDSPTLNTGLSFSSDDGSTSVAGGVFNDRLTPGTTTTFTFVPNISAVGANFDLTPGGPGLGLEFTLDATTGPVVVTQQIPDTASGGFFGLVSNLSISDIEIMPGTQGQNDFAESYDLDNLRYVAVTATTPEPGVFVTGLSMFGMTGLGLVRGRLRRRKRTAVA